MDEIKEISEKISKRFREVREWREMELWMAATKMLMSSRRLKRVEENKEQINLDLLFRAAKAYKVEIDVLLCRKDIPRGRGKGKRTKSKDTILIL